MGLKNLVAGVSLMASTLLPQTAVGQNTVKKVQEKTRMEMVTEFKDTIISPQDMQLSLSGLSDDQIRTHTIALVNKYRKYYTENKFCQIPLEQLSSNDTLNAVADRYASYLYDTKWYQSTNPHIDKSGHNPEDRVKADGMNAYVSECIAYDFSDFSFVKGWIHSMGHDIALRQSSGKKIGVGYCNGIIVLLISN